MVRSDLATLLMILRVSAFAGQSQNLAKV